MPKKEEINQTETLTTKDTENKSSSNKQINNSADKHSQTDDNTIHVRSVDAKDLKKDDLILDIRSHFQHAMMKLKQTHWHIEGQDVNPLEFIKKFGLDGQKTLYIICTSGRKSIEKAREFIKAGFKNVASVNGGMKAAFEAGLPMNEHQLWSVQRQVPLTAGIGTIIGIAAGLFISPWFFLLALFIGIGLTTWGMTGECTLEKILNHMPWNKQNNN